jgi:hypothetical protein
MEGAADGAVLGATEGEIEVEGAALGAILGEADTGAAEGVPKLNALMVSADSVATVRVKSGPVKLPAPTESASLDMMVPMTVVPAPTVAVVPTFHQALTRVVEGWLMTTTLAPAPKLRVVPMLKIHEASVRFSASRYTNLPACTS